MQCLSQIRVEQSKSCREVKVGVLVEVVLRQNFPDDSSKIPTLFAVEVNHKPESVCAKDEAPLNILLISVTLDTSHFDRSKSKDDADENIEAMLTTLDTSHFERSLLKDEAL